MKHAHRLPLVVLALVAVVGTMALHAAASPTSREHRLEATFTESNASVTNRIGDLGVFQLINTGTGTVEGFGNATTVVGVTQDRSVTPCGPGSWTNAAIRRIVVEGGVLVLRELVHICQTASGPAGSGTWTVDGASSTGVFAGARGSGESAIEVATRTATLEGKLKLAQSDDDD